ncbi:hypothetical protein DWB84_14300 [Saccharophagus sp. K07]|uniref:hypothetical protein n=1 Tax=Saccharophagus sp. K07 TaxID=2283636 RepID=UPI0016526598|nr:hypothetical protein [Saccharophagus sp. K07]MBC6906621.1 hypothetical protein [Saccharophagus sp. K07]
MPHSAFHFGNLLSLSKGYSNGCQKLIDILCHLRDDLALENPRGPLPQDGQIQKWVQEFYYPGLLELTWEEAVTSLLFRMQHCAAGWQQSKTYFTDLALSQLRKATPHSQLWRI